VPAPGIVARIRADANARWHAISERTDWLRHVLVAWERFRANNGAQYAAAITYFSFLALIPLILLGVSVAGFVLANDPERLTELFDNISSSLPGDFGKTVKDAVNSAIRNRTSVGLVGLAGILLTGLGWIANLRSASNAVWGVQPAKRNVVMAKVVDVVALAGLGVGVLISIGVTAVGTALAGTILNAAGINFAGAGILTAVVGIALGVAGDMVIFAWLLIRLPRVRVPLPIVVRGALLAAVGFEVLKLVGTRYIASVNRSPAAGVFGSVIGILVWLYLVARYLLFCMAWTATAVPSRQETTTGDTLAPAAGQPLDRRPVAVSSATVVTTLVATGAALGAAATAWVATRARRG
jgi:membrane protein